MMNVAFSKKMVAMLAAWSLIGFFYKAAIVALLLKLTTAVLSHMFSVPFTLVEGTGYTNSGLGIVVNDTCSGFNFLVVAACSFTCVIASVNAVRINTPLKVILVAVLPFILTVTANAGRIALAVYINQYFPDNALLHKPMFHQFMGLFFFMAFMFMAIITLQNFIHNTLTHEKNNKPGLAATG